jgi:hypothetical protein
MQTGIGKPEKGFGAMSPWKTLALVLASSTALAQTSATDSAVNAQIVDAWGLRWNRSETTSVPPGSTRNSVFLANQAAGLTSRDVRFQPVIASPADLSAFLTHDSTVLSVEDTLHRMQVVPGLPTDPRYDLEKFKPVRDAFNVSCLRSAGSYRTLAGQLLSSAMAVGGAALFAAKEPASYDKDCLTPLAVVPQPIRRVVGLLTTKDGVAFCTATILNDRTIVTSRHCFVAADNGKATTVRPQLFSELIGLQTLEPHFGRSRFTIAAPNPDTLRLAAFAPGEDYVVLKLKSWTFEHFAETHASPLENDQLPIATWIVGSNPTLTDASRARTPMESVRGSSPQACSILEATASGCLYHSCQTGPATSGAGVIAVDGNRVRLVGIHKGPTARAQGCETTPPLDLQLNLAAAITSSQLSGL